jgi:hypothetical protein
MWELFDQGMTLDAAARLVELQADRGVKGRSRRRPVYNLTPRR